MSANRSLEFVDTNIFVYAHDPSAGKKHQVARQLVEHLWETRQGCLSVQVLQEFYVTVTQKVAQPLKSEDTAQIIHDLSYWRVYAPNPADVLGAIDLQRHFQISFWDAMIVQSALCLGCCLIWSEDLSDGQRYNNIQVKDPFNQPA